MACLDLERHGRVRRFFYHRPHTVLALVLVFAVGVFAPGVASAQDATIAAKISIACCPSITAMCLKCMTPGYLSNSQTFRYFWHALTCVPQTELTGKPFLVIASMVSTDVTSLAAISGSHGSTATDTDNPVVPSSLILIFNPPAGM